jgi:hypothetical protein
VPSLVAGFDVCIVPFLDSALTRCVDPVKVYEYLAAGKPVVATVLPELERLEPGLVHIRRAGSAFLGGLRLAMGEAGDTALGRRRRSWASTQDWGGRAESLAKALS